MSFTIFNQKKIDSLTQPMFFGEGINIARYDQVRFPWIDKLTEKQLSFFWRPEEVDLADDRAQFDNLLDHEKDIFVNNLKYQILLDSVQGRSPTMAFSPIASLPEVEGFIQTWAFSETIHSRSYTHIIRNIFSNPSMIFDSILDDKEIIKRASSVTQEYDKLIELVNLRNLTQKENWSIENQKKLEDALFRTFVSVNALEAERFYVSFACSFAFAERKVMEGNAKVIKLIARDEALHLSFTQQVLKHWIDGKDTPSMQEAAIRNFEFIEQCFREVAQQEKDWANYLFKDGSMIGLNATILSQYIEYITDVRVKALGMSPIFNRTDNPLSWMNSWLSSSNVQVAPQETEISSYLTGQVDSNIKDDDFDGFTL